MQRAGHQRPVAVRATSSTPPPTKTATTVVLRLIDDPPPAHLNDVDVSRGDGTSQRAPQQQALEFAIRKRIESRLPGRVRNLTVRIDDDVVILEGECATFYTKQLAQHAAMGVLDNEHLENAIVVTVPQ